MDNKERPLDIYLMGIGGTGMGAFAGLLKQKGHRVCGSDSAVYSPMKEKLAEWGITYRTPYDDKNLTDAPDLVIVGNVIRKDNPEAVAVREKEFCKRLVSCCAQQTFFAQIDPDSGKRYTRQND